MFFRHETKKVFENLSMIKLLVNLIFTTSPFQKYGDTFNSYNAASELMVYAIKYKDEVIALMINGVFRLFFHTLFRSN